MDRRRQPAMRAGGGGTRDRPGTEPEPEAGFRAWFRRASALTRWIILVLCVGLGTAALIAIGVAALVTLLESSV
jgi:hypothetical protein